jgi:hypothetical protein
VNALPERPRLSPEWRKRLERLSETTGKAPPPDLAAIVRDELQLDLTARYAGLPLAHPFGKASGQLSLKLQQIDADVEAGVAFIVLKTVIAEDAESQRTMDEWAVAETRMQVEPIASSGGRDGWTVTWKGRGWSGSLDEYLEFFGAAGERAARSDVPVIPSVKFHLPADDEEFKVQEYEHTTSRLLEVWERVGLGDRMALEKDLSPTLAADERSNTRDRVLGWLDRVPGLIEAAGRGRVRLGVKLMNALFDDDFQVQMIDILQSTAKPAPSYLIVFNRLFDVTRGVAYGGWDLSDRNLRVLDLARERLSTLLPMSATGNICSGKMMVEYARRGCENGQVHTFFQVPLSEYSATGGNRSARALHTLILHPTDGLAVWLRHLHEAGQLDAQDGMVRFLDLVEKARREFEWPDS